MPGGKGAPPARFFRLALYVSNKAADFPWKPAVVRDVVRARVRLNARG